MIAYEKKEVIAPLRMHVDKGRDTLLSMPAWGDRYFCTKLVSAFPGNRAFDLPVTMGAVLVSDGVTGEPLALMNAAKLTALRTGALGALAVKFLTPATTSSIGLIGCGVQGTHLAALASSVRKLSTIYYLHRSEHGSELLSSSMHTWFPEVSVLPCHSAEELLSKTNVVVAATPSIEPVLPNDESLLHGKLYISIGSYKPSMQEFPDAVYRLAGKLFMDSEFARVEAGDCINPVKKNILKETDLLTLGKVLIGEQKVNVQDTLVYKSTGMAVYDLFVAQAIYEQAKQSNVGAQVDFS